MPSLRLIPTSEAHGQSGGRASRLPASQLSRKSARTPWTSERPGRLNRLYVELLQLLKDNPEWGTAERRHDMNHFLARLIFCFIAEDTSIFDGTDLHTEAIAPDELEGLVQYQ